MEYYIAGTMVDRDEKKCVKGGGIKVTWELGNELLGGGKETKR